MLSDDKVAKLREKVRLANRQRELTGYAGTFGPFEMEALLAEVDALRERLAAAERDNAALYEQARDEHVIGQAFVDRINELEQREQQARAIIEPVAEQRGDCNYCGFLQMVANVQGDEHSPDCPVTQARAWLAASEPAAQRAAAQEAPDLGADTPANRARLERLHRDIMAAGERIGTEDDE